MGTEVALSLAMMKSILSALLIFALSPFAQGECWTQINALLKEKGRYSTFSRKIDYRGGSLLFTPSLDSNKIAISSLTSGRVLYVAKDYKKVVGVISPGPGQFVLLIEIKSRVLLAKNLIDGTVTKVNVDSEGLSLGQVGLTPTHIGAIKNLYISYLMHKPVNKRYAAPENDLSEKDTRWYDQEGEPMRLRATDDVRSNNVLRGSSQLDREDSPER